MNLREEPLRFGNLNLQNQKALLQPHMIYLIKVHSVNDANQTGHGFIHLKKKTFNINYDKFRGISTKLSTEGQFKS